MLALMVQRYMVHTCKHVKSRSFSPQQSYSGGLLIQAISRPWRLTQLPDKVLDGGPQLGHGLAEPLRHRILASLPSLVCPVWFTQG